MAEPRPDLGTLQLEFLNAVYGDEEGRLAAWLDSNTKRLDIYRNSLTLTLCDLLDRFYPVTRALLGPNCFGALARDHIKARRLSEGNLNLYGADLAGFMTSHAPMDDILAQHPYVADVARLESALRHAAQADDVPEGTEISDFDALLAAPDLVRLQPSVQLVDQTWNGSDLHAAHGEDRLETITPTRSPHSLLIGRDRDGRVVSLTLEPSESIFIEGMVCNRGLLAAVESCEPAQRDGAQAILARLVPLGFLWISPCGAQT